MAWHNATLLAQENIELLAEIQKDKNKRKCSRKMMQEGASLTREETQNLIDEVNAANQLAQDTPASYIPRI